MYQRFKDCLLKPRNIADYIKEPKKTTIIYTIIVLIIYIIPFILITLLSKSTVTTLSSSVAKDFINAEQINYVIEDSKLKSIDGENIPQIIKTELVLEEAYKLNALYVFDITGNSFEEVLDIDSGSYIIFLFTENSFKISILEVSKTVSDDSGNKPGMTVSLETSNNNDNKLFLIDLEYSKLGLTNVNLALNKDNNTINFKNEIATLVDAVYDEIKMKLLPIIIIVVLLISVGYYFFTVLFISLLFKLLYRYLQVDFGIVFKASILCSTPYVICSLLALLTNVTFLEVIGQFIMIVYVTKALTTYKIKYDGGVPLPRYMQNMMNEEKEEEKGSGDDEL